MWNSVVFNTQWVVNNYIVKYNQWQKEIPSWISLKVYSFIDFENW